MKTLQLNGVGVRYRLGFLVFVSLVALLAVGAGGWLGISRVSHSVLTLQDERLPAATWLAEIRVSSNMLVQLSYEVLAREKQAFAQSKFAQTLSRKEAVGTSLNEAMNAYEALPKTDDEKEAWTSFKEAMGPWKAGNDELSGLIKAMAENDDAAKQLQLFSQYKVPLANWGYTQARVDLALSSLLALNKDEVQKTRDLDESTIKLSKRFMAIASALAAAILLVLAVICVRSITKPLGRLRETIVGVANSNDFTGRAEVNGKDEIAQTAAAFNRLLEDVQASLREVLDHAENIAVASDKASSTSRQAAESSENQSEAASGMAAAIEEMTVSISHINDGAQGTLSRARDAGEAADNGSQSIAHSHAEMDKIAQTMTQATAAIEKLSKESTSISTILQVIKEVADQTNLLALNAAIEAARAGEQGRGFAVVADEVRKLAERTTASTQAIGDLVQSMQSSGDEAVNWMNSVNQQVQNGKALSDVAVGHIDEIRDNSRQLVDSVTDISDAIGEQSSTAQSIAQQVETVARLSEENSTTAKETETISMDLDRLANSLRQAVSKFSV